MSASSIALEPACPEQGVAFTTVDRRAGLSYEEFVQEYRNPGRPVIFTDLSKDWPALGRYTPDYFRQHHGQRPVRIGERTYRLAEFLDLLESSTPDRPTPYPCKLDLRGEYADLAPDVQPRPRLAQPDRTRSRLVPGRFLGGSADLEVFIGGPGGEFPYIHYDYLGFYAYINQIYGEKEFYVFPPGQEEWLYVDADRPWMSKVENAFRPDLDKYPLFAHAQPVTVVLKPGETLFIPCGVWHTARSKTVSISVAFDQLCHSNWKFFSDDVARSFYPAPWKRAVVRAYLAAVGAALRVREAIAGEL